MGQILPGVVVAFENPKGGVGETKPDKSLDFLIQINRSLCYKVTTHIVTGKRKAISYKIHNY